MSYCSQVGVVKRVFPSIFKVVAAGRAGDTRLWTSSASINDNLLTNSAIFDFKLARSTSGNVVLFIDGMFVESITGKCPSATVVPTNSRMFYATKIHVDAAIAAGTQLQQPRIPCVPAANRFSYNQLAYCGDTGIPATQWVKPPLSTGGDAILHVMTCQRLASCTATAAPVVQAIQCSLGAMVQTFVGAQNCPASFTSSIAAETLQLPNPAQRGFGSSATAASIEALCKVGAAEMPDVQIERRATSILGCDGSLPSHNHGTDISGASTSCGAVLRPILLREPVAFVPTYAHIKAMPRGSLSSMKLVAQEHINLGHHEIKAS
jgi:hypothetical protein